MPICLHTTLQFESSNPNLPVLEAMQQFTLDAITASGNVSMTDAQKWALNHFFYQIGAIDNNGIYAKLGGLYMPLICGDVLAKAMVDYKGVESEDISTKDVKFQSHGLVKNNPSAIMSNSSIILRNDYAGSVSNLTVAAMLTENFLSDSAIELLLIGFRGSSDSGSQIVRAAQDTNKNYMQLFEKRPTYPAKRAFSGAIGTINGANYSALFIGDGNYENSSVTDYGTAPSAVNYVTLYWNAVAPIGIYAYGSALTPSEMTLLANAMKELTRAFVTL